MTLPTEESLDGYTITFRREILFYLHQLINDAIPITIMFDEGRDSILTILLDVDEEKGELIFDWGGSDEINQRFLASERNFFVALPQGVRNQFLAGKPWQVAYKKRAAFAVRLPKKYVRLQRRDYFRLVLPITQRPICSFTAKSESTFDTAVVDIGLGGVGLEIAAASVPFEVGTTISEALIKLGNFGELTVDFEIRYIGQTTRGARQATRLGCQFDHLAPAQEHFLQRYITHVQREERARLGI